MYLWIQIYMTQMDNKKIKSKAKQYKYNNNI